MADNSQSQLGFALLVSLIVVSVIVSIGLVILDVTIKQLRLSSNSTDSEIAFHAANAGMECARFWRREMSDRIEGDEFDNPVYNPGNSMLNISCFGENIGNVNAVDMNEMSGSDGEAFFYTYEFTWDGGARCTEIQMVTVSADVFDGSGPGDGVQVSESEMQSRILGYPDGQGLVCSAGSFCTVISSQGYNKGCAQKNSFGTVQREVLLEL